MKDIKKFLLPDYFDSFACKMGACRHACCEGWPISFSLNDYFKLVGAECSPELRGKLDRAVRVALHPTPEAYAQISPCYDGSCPMRGKDGLCTIHAELGEDLLSAVCRLYPRGVRMGKSHECSCANSCEAVLEILLTKKDAMTFSERPMDFSVPEPSERQFHFHSAGREREIRLWLIGFMQNRSYPIPRRILLLGEALTAMDEALSKNDEARIDRLLSGEEVPETTEMTEHGHNHLRFGMEIAKRMVEIMDERSDSIREYGEAALAYFGDGEVGSRRYLSAENRFRQLIPDWEVWFEQMMVNYMFFSQFPFQDRPVSFLDEYLALCAVYVLLRFLLLGWMSEHQGMDTLVDVAAAAFRLIEHTEFDRYAGPILKQLGCDDRAQLYNILCL